MEQEIKDPHVATPKLELRKIKVNTWATRETNCYSAELWVNGNLAAHCFNDGGGGADRFDTYGIPNGHVLLKIAQEHCITLPALAGVGEEWRDLPMDLELWIGQQIDQIATEKEHAKLMTRMNKDMLNAIVVGVRGASSYLIYKMKAPFSSYDMEDTFVQEALKKSISRIKGDLKEGEEILNTNIPADILNVPAAQKVS